MSHPVAGEPPATGSRVAPPPGGYSRTEWGLLTTLPGQVVVAAASPGPGRAGRGVAAGLAGLDAVAAGRAFDSDLVRAVVATIYARPDESPARVGHPTDPADPTDPTDPTDLADQANPADQADLLAACRAAVRVLDRWADPADSAAYRQWVQSVAARVCRVPPAGAGGSGPGPLPHPADLRLLDRLGRALRLR
ncbi:hypothetical protein ACN28G_00870 [Micromonospora sp. WMMA1923]|uniref:hypothetical protein n=1 Tax=Micromonospora sp. WMMA1923 TaxID=3404125 RepID=UPI003B93F42D